MQHLIKKQTINLVLPKQLDAFSMQHSVSRHYWHDVLPLLEQEFDERSNDEELIQIEQLQIDLGVISEKEMMPDNWSDAVLSKIREQLDEKIGKRAEGKTYIREMKTLSICRQWLFYMQKGYLPWNTIQVTEKWYNQVLEALATDFASVAALKKLIRENAMVTRRIILQHKEEFLVKLTEILTAQNQRALPDAIAGFDFKENRVEIWEQVLLLTTGKGKDLTTERLIEQIYKKEADIIIKSNPAQISESVSAQHIKEPAGESIDEEGIFVQYAGIVLVHPFLHSLFKKLRLVKEGKFVRSILRENVFAQQKALYLLHFIATGETSAEEFELTVPKILCNWPPGMPVEKDIELNTEELSETEKMLQAAIGQWEVLKNTSADGLREGFLQRRGKFFSRNDKRYLHVENASLDVLLDKLPWNLNVVKLPWMKEILWVEWR